MERGKEEREAEGVFFSIVVQPVEILHWIPSLTLCPGRYWVVENPQSTEQLQNPDRTGLCHGKLILLFL